MAVTSTMRGVRVPGDELQADRPHRSLDEVILLRFPVLARGFRALWARLPLRSRVRRALTVRIVRQGMAAVNRRDFDVLFLGFDPHIEYVMPEGGTPFMPDLAEHHHGVEAYRAVWLSILESFQDLQAEVEEFIDLGDAFVMTATYHGHGAMSGAPISQRLYQVFTLRDGIAVTQRDFVERDEAFAAVDR